MLKNTFNKLFSKKKKKKDSKQQKQFQCYHKDVPLSSSVESDDQLDDELKSAKKFIQNYRKKLTNDDYQLTIGATVNAGAQATLQGLNNNLKEYKMFISDLKARRTVDKENNAQRIVDRKSSKPLIGRLFNLKSLTLNKKPENNSQKEFRTYLHSSAHHSHTNQQLIREIDEINSRRKLNQRIDLENYFKQNFCNCKNQRNVLQINNEINLPKNSTKSKQEFVNYNHIQKDFGRDPRGDLKTLQLSDNYSTDYSAADLSDTHLSSVSKYIVDEQSEDRQKDDSDDLSRYEYDQAKLIETEVKKFDEKYSGGYESPVYSNRSNAPSESSLCQSSDSLDLSYMDDSSQPFCYSLTSDLAEEDDDQYLDTYTIGSANTDENPISTDNYTKLIQKLTHSDMMRKRLLELCGQQDSLDFEQEFSENNFPRVLNLDSGTFAVTFLAFDRENNLVVLKVIRTISKDIQSKLNQLTYSGTETFYEVYSEVMISKALSSLHNIKVNTAHCFPKILFTKLVHGRIPENFIITRLKDSKPDQVQAFTLEQFYDALNRNQQFTRTNSCIQSDKKKFLKPEPFKLFPDAPVEYTVIAMKYVGKPIWKRLLNRQLNAQQLFSVAQQLIFGLACAERQFNFEHRDLHISNILVKRTRKSEVEFVINNQIYKLSTFGYRCFVVDMTFSRLSINNQVFFKDLSAVLYKRYEPDKGKKLKMQDMVYQLMRDEIGENWQRFRPRTNIHWLAYVLKTIKGCELYKKNHGPISQLLVEYINQIDNCTNLSDLIAYIVERSSDAGAESQ